MKHGYKVVLTELNVDNERVHPTAQLQFGFQSHDDLSEIVSRVSAKKLFSEQETKAFVVGMKMFSSIMLENRDHEMFSEFMPHFGEFMKKLKKSPGPAPVE